MTLPTRRTVITGLAGTITAGSLIRPQPADASPFHSAIQQGLTYFQQQVAIQKGLCADLTAAIATGDQETAELAYEFSRAPYEQIEVHAGAFEDIDFAIDARPYAVDGGETNESFVGFHRIEALIYRDHNLTAALPYARQLEASMVELESALQDQSRFDPVQFMDGMQSLSEEVAAKKISSEEETWSDLSLIIFQNNFLGVQSQLAGFYPALSQVSESLVNDAEVAFLTAQATLEPFFDSPRVTRYSDVRAAERGAIARSAYSIRDAVRNARDALEIA